MAGLHTRKFNAESLELVGVKLTQTSGPLHLPSTLPRYPDVNAHFRSTHTYFSVRWVRAEFSQFPWTTGQITTFLLGGRCDVIAGFTRWPLKTDVLMVNTFNHFISPSHRVITTQSLSLNSSNAALPSSPYPTLPTNSFSLLKYKGAIQNTSCYKLLSPLCLYKVRHIWS